MWFIFQCSIWELEVLVEEEVVDEAENHFGVHEPPGQWSMISDQDHKKLLLYTWTLCWSPWMGRIFCPKTKLLGCNMCRKKIWHIVWVIFTLVPLELLKPYDITPSRFNSLQHASHKPISHTVMSHTQFCTLNPWFPKLWSLVPMISPWLRNSSMNCNMHQTKLSQMLCESYIYSSAPWTLDSRSPDLWSYDVTLSRFKRGPSHWHTQYLRSDRWEQRWSRCCFCSFSALQPP